MTASSTSPASTSTPNGFKHLLPESFAPTEYDVVIGRGKQVRQHNVRFYESIRAIADDYAAADKARKSYLLSHLVKQVYAKSPKAGFVKKDPTSGRYYAVEEALARTTCCQAMRDCLHNHYKSSRQFKQQRRRAARKETTGATNCSALTLTRSVTPEQSFYYAQDICPAPASSTSDLFSILAGAFANKPVDPQEDPFAPVPLPELPMYNNQKSGLSIMEDISSSLSNILEDTDLMEPFPMETLNLDNLFALSS